MLAELPHSHHLDLHVSIHKFCLDLRGIPSMHMQRCCQVKFSDGSESAIA